jgi:hypothetical protein
VGEGSHAHAMDWFGASQKTKPPEEYGSWRKWVGYAGGVSGREEPLREFEEATRVRDVVLCDWCITGVKLLTYVGDVGVDGTEAYGVYGGGGRAS